MAAWKLLCALLAALSLQGAWKETFDSGKLDQGRWVVTAENDFKVRVIDVIDVKKNGDGDYRLRLKADTIGTNDDTVKFLGVRSKSRFGIHKGQTISAQLDWNDQNNGSYLSAALILAPTATSKNPLEEANWIKVEYVGVPPGLNVRMVVAAKTKGSVKDLYTEGWPETNRVGRQISVVKASVEATGSGFRILENGKEVYDSGRTPIPFDFTYVYLQVSSHSNYSARELYFDDIQGVESP